MQTALVDAFRAGDAPKRLALLMDKTDLLPGDAWRTSINLWLGACDAAVLILSPDALQSSYVAFEANVLGFRRTRDAGFTIIPVLCGGVTMDDVKKSPLNPSQVHEWQTAVEGGPEDAVASVLARLEGLQPLAACPIYKLARALDGYFPSNETSIENAAKRIDLELPWEIETKKRRLALALLGVGMRKEAAMAIRTLHLDPELRKSGYTADIVKLVSAAWVDLGADDLADLMQSAAPPAMVLNAESPEIARMYARAAQYRVEELKPWHFCVAETIKPPPRGADMEEANRQFATELAASVRTALCEEFKVSGKTALQQELQETAELEEPVVVAMRLHLVNDEILAGLRGELPTVTFFLLTGYGCDVEEMPETLVIVRPQLRDKDESECLTSYARFQSFVNKQGGTV